MYVHLYLYLCIWYLYVPCLYLYVPVYASGPVSVSTPVQTCTSDKVPVPVHTCTSMRQYYCLYLPVLLCLYVLAPVKVLNAPVSVHFFLNVLVPINAFVCMHPYLYRHVCKFGFTYTHKYSTCVLVCVCTCAFTCIYTCRYSYLHMPVPVLLHTDPAGEEGAVLELAQVESDEICSCHEHQWQQGCIWFSNNLPRIPGGCSVVTPRWRYCVVSTVTVLEGMLLKDLKTKPRRKT